MINTNRRTYILTRVIMLLTFFIGSIIYIQAQSSKPNIVVFLCDDLGYGDLSSFGHPFIKTPNIDRLAAEGLKLTNFYAAAPVCSPSRVGMLTGRSPNRAGIYDFISVGGKPIKEDKDLVHLRSQEETIPQILKKVGYSTCLVGKWHCSSLFNSTEQPQPDHFGFDHWFATHNNAAPSHENPTNFVRNGDEVDATDGFSCQIVVDEAIEWVKSRESDEPYFLEIAFHEPHVPIASPKDMITEYMPFAKNEKEAMFFANVANIDKAVGRFLEFLEEQGSENTMIIFTSDNGPETLMRYARADKSYGSPGPLKGMKLWTNEAGFRVPCIIKWEGKLGLKGTSDEVISALDFMPTFCEIAGAAQPERTLDGESITGFLKGDTFAREKPLLWIFYNALNEERVAMRVGNYKIMARLSYNDEYLPMFVNVYPGNQEIVKNAELTDFVLYDLIDDIGETSVITESEPEVFDQLKLQLEAAYNELLADSPVWVRK